MGSLQDLIEEARLRTLWWILCIFVVSYFLTHTSKSMLMNIPIAICLVSGLRILFNEVEFRWKAQKSGPISYLSHLEKKQLAVNDSRFTAPPPPQKWKRKIDSPIIEAAVVDFVNKVLHDFVIDLWYSDITPDKEAPELIRGIVMDVLGELSGRIKELNLVDLLTRDMVDLVGDHLELFRRNQDAIGVDVMVRLSSEERDERLKHNLLVSKELHPALISSECEYKVLQRLMGGLLAIVLRQRESQSPLVRCFARELLTSLVIQPIMNFASPGYINELIEYIIVAYNKGFTDTTPDQSHNMDSSRHEGTVSIHCGQSGESDIEKNTLESNHGADMSMASTIQDEVVHTGHAEWAKGYKSATERRIEVLMPENLENMWAIGTNYKNKIGKTSASGIQASEVTSPLSGTMPKQNLMAEIHKQKSVASVGLKKKAFMPLPFKPQQDTQSTYLRLGALSGSQELKKEVSPNGTSTIHGSENTTTVVASTENRRLKKSNSTSDMTVKPNPGHMFVGEGNTPPIINEYYSADIKKLSVEGRMSSSDMVIRHEGHVPKLRCRVTGAYFEKNSSTPFAVYSIAVTDSDNNTWFVKRRYRNFERLHRHLKDIPNYTLQLPPKRIFSSSTEDSFVHQRCIQLDKYLRDLLSIANVAEQHEVWDFLSSSSKNYAFGRSSSVMRTLAVNVDDAVDDIVRQFKGVSDGLARKATSSSMLSSGQSSSVSSRNMSFNAADDIKKLAMKQNTSESMHSFSDNDEGDKDANQGEQVASSNHANGWHSSSESNSRGFSLAAVKHKDVNNLNLEKIGGSRLQAKSDSVGRYPVSNLALLSAPQQDPTVVPPEWSPPNLSVPVLNLVDNLFQLKRRGWLRRQVFWISKQIVHLVMEDAIDDWLLRQIQLICREDVVAQGIRLVQDILWPGGTFFLRLRAQVQPDEFEATGGSEETTRQPGGIGAAQPGSFEQQLEAARRASEVKKMIFDGAPAALVSLIGQKQYRQCASDIYFFLQSTVCLKQLGYGMLELVLVSIFPELRDLVMDIHEMEKMHNTQPV